MRRVVTDGGKRGVAGGREEEGIFLIPSLLHVDLLLMLKFLPPYWGTYACFQGFIGSFKLVQTIRAQWYKGLQSYNIIASAVQKTTLFIFLGFRAMRRDTRGCFVSVLNNHNSYQKKRILRKTWFEIAICMSFVYFEGNVLHYSESILYSLEFLFLRIIRVHSSVIGQVVVHEI